MAGNALPLAGPPVMTGFPVNSIEGTARRRPDTAHGAGRAMFRENSRRGCGMTRAEATTRPLVAVAGQRAGRPGDSGLYRRIGG